MIVCWTGADDHKSGRGCGKLNAPYYTIVSGINPVLDFKVEN